jgi:tetratricopeptide (TPR) repeat protein
MARVLNNIGWQYANLGEYQPALEHCQQSLALLRDTDDLRGQGTALDSLGYIHHRLGDCPQAITYYRQALDRIRASGDRWNEAETLEHLGEACRDAGELEAARDAWRQAVAILDELGLPDADSLRARLGSDPAAKPDHGDDAEPDRGNGGG